MASSNESFQTALAVAFIDIGECRVFLGEIGYPQQQMPQVANSMMFWAEVVRKIELGMLPEGGLELLAAAALRWYPGNPAFKNAMVTFTAPQPAAPPSVARPATPGAPPGHPTIPAPDRSTPPSTPLLPAPTQPDAPSARPAKSEDPQPSQNSPTPPTPVQAPPALSPLPPPLVPPVTLVEVIGSTRFEEIRAIVEQSVPSSRMLYAAFQSAAFHVPAESAATAVRQALIGFPDQVQVCAGTYDHVPHLLGLLTVLGPDGQRFELRGVSTTTRVSGIPTAVMREYNELATDSRGRRLRIVVDLVLPGNQVRRLNPNATLHEASVQDGASVRLSVETTAGVDIDRFLSFAKRARNQILNFAKGHPEFQVVEMDSPDAPSLFRIRLESPGFEPLDGGGVRERNSHDLQILLPSRFPDAAPQVRWLTPVYHPNIADLGSGQYGGYLCLGLLEDQYQPGISFNVLCQMIIDVTSYRQYGLPSRFDPDGPGVMNVEAAEWAATGHGQTSIVEIGGMSGLDRLREPNEDIERPLRVIRGSLHGMA
jgi:hypothetical protein